MKKLTPGLCAAYKADAMRGLHHEDDRYMLALYGPAAPSPPRGGFYGAKRGGAMRSANGENQIVQSFDAGAGGRCACFQPFDNHSGSA